MFVLSGSIYLFLFVIVANYLFPSGVLFLIHYKPLSSLFVFPLDFHAFPLVVLFPLFFSDTEPVHFQTFHVGLARICIITILLFCWNWFFCGVFAFEMKLSFAKPTFYSCFKVFITYWIYVSHDILCFVPDLTSFELQVIYLLYYFFIYAPGSKTFCSFWRHFYCNYHIFFQLACWFPSPSFCLFLFHLYSLLLHYCSLFLFSWWGMLCVLLVSTFCGC